MKITPTPLVFLLYIDLKKTDKLSDNCLEL